MIKKGEKSIPSMGGKVMAERQRAEARARYLESPNKCLHCSLVIQIPDGGKIQYARRKQFCDHRCAASHNNKGRQRHSKVKCSSCSKPIRIRIGEAALCRKCSPPRDLKPRTRTKDQLSSVRSGYQSARTDIRVHAAKVYARSGRPMICQCGYSKHVEICHIKSVASFSGATTIDEINASDNLVALCPNCHWEFDNGNLKLVAGARIEPATQPGL